MPELPEVETTARLLRPLLTGRTIAAVQHLDYPPLVAPFSPEAFRSAVAGRQILAVGRRAKYILLSLDDGFTLTIHLGMSGTLFVAPQAAPADRHTRAILDLDHGRGLRFCDPRKFGRMRLLSPAQYGRLDARLGPEPLDSADDESGWTARLRRRSRARLKPLLMDQRFLAGLGNIYADEALHRAGLHPLRPAGSLSDEEASRLLRAVIEVLSAAVTAQGTTLPDGAYRFGEGEHGRFAERLRVYGRAGEPCPTCGHPIGRERIGGRSSHFCPRCQPIGDGDPVRSPSTAARHSPRPVVE